MKYYLLITIKDIGQIEFYVKYYDSNIKKPFYNPTIGITISKKINKNIIKYNQKDNRAFAKRNCSISQGKKQFPKAAKKLSTVKADKHL